MADVLVEMKGITKRWPGVVALQDVDFSLHAGEIHMVLGENGAGKSTLIKVLSGAIAPDEGTISVDGMEMPYGSPATILNAGVRAIYQELSLCPDLDIARNLYLGMEPRTIGGWIDTRALYRSAAEHLREIGLSLNPRRTVRTLSVTEAKLVEIARSLVSDTKVLILDEPTDVLEDSARNELFALIDRLRTARRIGFIYISHRYAEVHDLGDRVTVLRDGRHAGTYEIADLTLDEMIGKMVGGTVPRESTKRAAPRDEVQLELRSFGAPPRVQPMDLLVRSGEIVAITGLMGAGKTELARALAGVDPGVGDVLVRGRPADLRSPRAAIRSGISFLTEDRKQQGLILDHTLSDNYALPNRNRLSRWGLVDHRRKKVEMRTHMQALAIKAHSDTVAARTLSGGNQQKVVLAKWLGLGTDVILFDEPTRGIDINGRRDFYRLISALAAEGTAVLVFTSDYAEAIELAHRVIVLQRGVVAGSFDATRTSERELLSTAINTPTERNSHEVTVHLS